MSEQRVEHLVRAPAPHRLRAPLAVLVPVLVGLLVAVVATASRGSPARAGGSPPGIDLSAAIGDVLVVAFALVAGALALLAYLTWPGRRRRDDDAPQLVRQLQPAGWRQKLLVLFVALLVVGGPLAVVGYLAHNDHPKPPPSPISGRGGPGAVPGQRPAVAPSHDGSVGVHWVVLLVVAAVAAALAAYLVVLARSRRGGDAEPELAVRELVEAVADSLEDLEREPDPRRAVIKAYARMERVLAANGLPRRAYEAPVEYLTRALGALRTGGASARRLTALFERAKFSSHVVDQTMKSDAIDALVALRSDLEAER